MKWYLGHHFTVLTHNPLNKCDHQGANFPFYTTNMWVLQILKHSQIILLQALKKLETLFFSPKRSQLSCFQRQPISGNENKGKESF